MTPRKRRWLAASLGTGLVLLLVVLASLDTLGSLNAPQRFELTEVTTFEPPPPPPPPPARPSAARNGGSTGRQLTLRSSQAPVALDTMQLQVQFAAAEIGKLNIAGFGQGVGVGAGDGTGDGSGSGYELALVSELDQQPMVVSAPLFGYPKQATARGIVEFDLEFHILIDEQGRTYPIAIVQNPFPELAPQLLEYASKVRFSPPTRLGIPVRTEYLWPVRIKR
ncbi:MAG TPA: hypothetical protein VE907_17780 [Gammaproteobacteria bacterium]|nr:hypothetical protein [Gammaproteobacteria bacterium]